MPAKARMLKRLAQAGYRDFYEGEVAAMIASDLEAGGSKIRERDLAKFQPRWLAPLKGTYRHFEINAIPGLSGGPSFVDAAGRLSKSSINAKSTPGEAALAYATAIRDAYEVRLTTLGHAAMKDAGCTSHLSVVDRHGTMVALRLARRVAQRRHADEQRHDVVRPATEPAEQHRAGCAAAGEHVSAGVDARRQAGAGDRRRRRPHHLSDGASARLLSRRLWPFA
jgi:gamma-glutamyltranspeptidase